MRAEEFDIYTIIASLQGTCDTVQQVIEAHHPEMDENDMTPEDEQILNSELFLCDQCGWWYEYSEHNSDEDTGESICDDCFGDAD